MESTDEESSYTKIMVHTSKHSMFPARYVLCLMGFLGFFNVYALRLNLSVAMVAMVKEPHHSPTAHTSVACPDLWSNTSGINSTTQNRGEFDWDSNTQGLVLGSFFYGYVVTQIPGGVFAEKFGAKWLYGIGMLITIVFTFLTPIAARWSIWALVAARVIEGIGEGVTYPAMNALIGRWSPKLERSRLSTIIYNGSPVGTVVALSLSGVLSDSDFLGGWPSVFYVFGFIGLVWFVLWMWLVHDSPEKHPHISQEEYRYIMDGREEPTNAPTPWRHILTSVPMWSLIITHIGEGWSYYTLLIELPNYLSNILHYNLQENGVLSALPNLLHAIFAIAASFMADRMRAAGRISISNIRKIFNSLGMFVPAIALFIIPFIGCRPIIILVLLSLSLGMNGAVYSGCMVNHVDMAPDYAGTLFGITNFFGNFCGFLVPSYVGWILEDGQTVGSWSIIFITSGIIFVVSGLIYNIFTSSELQDWSTKGSRSYLEMKPQLNNEYVIP